ncbi:putative serine-TYPE carboxypeptidase F precursor [Podospora appendiculata]|uniref:Carboxypeptidase n=1 Tax=Podospora appendiculata TaxID=314037 RepID=A0AAE0X493_9PEZI|nr:putative serine-TYPE carboxypeptidase F precursor [Podospora appendiculata]
MRWAPLVLSLLLSATATTVGASRSFAHPDRIREKLNQRKLKAAPASDHHEVLSRAVVKPQFLNSNTSRFAVNGSAIPDVDFDVGESYAGTLPISSDPKEQSSLFWWFFPSTNPAAKKEILIWLNGGPGCSSLEGLLQENGPFVWQYGTFKPVANPWGWNSLTNVIWVEQPVGTGFSQGKVTAQNEEDVAAQFLGFWKNFIDTFSMQGYKVYIAGESYAGLYCPYIASAMLDKKDNTYYNMSGLLIYDPVIAKDEIQEPIPVLQFTQYWAGLFPFNDTFKADLEVRDKKCGYTDYVEKYLVYPPRGPAPSKLPGTDASGQTLDDCWGIYNDIFNAILLLNPCFDIYQVATTCPLLWDVLGFPGSMFYLPTGAKIYFDRPEVKKAIHAPNITWTTCADGDVFVKGRDRSDPSNVRALPHVIDKTQNVIIAHGALDMVLLANGTLLGIQNMTWGGKLGFQHRPTEPFYVPYNVDLTTTEVLAAGGVFGTTHTERGLTYVGIDLSGHMVPQYAPSAAYRNLEFLLGRVSCMNCTVPFTTDKSAPQSTQPLGLGTAPQGWSTGSKTCKARRSAPVSRVRGFTKERPDA